MLYRCKSCQTIFNTVYYKVASSNTSRLEAHADISSTLVKNKRIYTGQYTFPILLLNDDNMLEEHKGREKNVVYRRLFLENPHFVL